MRWTRALRPSGPRYGAWAEVRRLPRRQAQCLALFYIYGCSVKETAEVIGCSEGTVKTHLARGRAAMAARLDIHLDEGV